MRVRGSGCWRRLLDPRALPRRMLRSGRDAIMTVALRFSHMSASASVDFVPRDLAHVQAQDSHRLALDLVMTVFNFCRA